ncbi:metalloprotease [Segetibacter sp. 3557_3]|uniref:KPN_02809 family neutral zinc metallopeptidase n=1 Tax=Segetibacter sp. 3557_3 TaxID=2547429 RepID=UPI001058E3B7|nr:neutral zinc metallopeptidase [Segetibacter sp. 3557_3]TDH28758.1 metalloprotease [Segetibacter sp. 3557_3]
MLWRGRQGSSNVEDRRGMSGKGVAVGGGIGGVIIALLYMFLGGDPSQMPQIGVGAGSSREMSADEKAADDTLAQFASVVLKETEDVWTSAIQGYQKPRLVMFRDAVESGCGGATSASGPFYCPADQKVYLDLAFFQDLRQRFGAPGDFAMAYVIAHEVGHHVQNLMGTSDKVQRARGQLSQAEYNKLSVKLELQADFYAGVWAHHAQNTKGILEDGDIEEALTAASAIGDDRLQKEAQGRVSPESFTHGTSAQRMYWFKKGYETGDIRAGDTFSSTEVQ